MNLYLLDVLCNHSITLAAVAGVIRWKYIVKSYRPFLLFIFTGFVNETISLLLMESQASNMVNSNVYVFVEYIILLYQFYKWKACHAKRLYLFAWLGTSVWILDNAVINTLADPNSLFRCFACFVFVFFSIDKMNSLIVNAKGALLRDSSFLICAALLLFNGCKVFVEGFHLFHVPFDTLFYNYLWLTLSFVNGFSNIIFAIAILWIPTKEEFILPY